MRVRVLAIAVLWVLSLVGVSVWAQSTQPTPTLGARPGEPIITGADIGFQRVPTGASGDPERVSGRWMVRINGQWIETTTAPSVRLAR
jgi:hypothetical protein